VLGHAPPAAPEGGGFASGGHANPQKCRFSKRFRRHFSSSLSWNQNLLHSAGRLSRGHRQRHDFPQHAAKRPPRQMTLRRQQPIVAGVVNQTAPGFQQPLLQAHAEISKRDMQVLSTSQLIYIATVRKDGNQSKAAPV